MHVEVDRDRCRSHGLCLMAAPELFDLGGDGIVAVLAQPDSPDLEQSASVAELDCPERAITLIR
jgi:ferredoxin